MGKNIGSPTKYTSAGEIRRDFPFFRFIDFCNLLPLLSDKSDVDGLLESGVLL